jgi:glucan phosphoethanolaminetransferase (alkaline phosphatase superfamily)
MSTQDIILRYSIPLVGFLLVLIAVSYRHAMRPIFSLGNLTLLSSLVYALCLAMFYVDLCVKYDGATRKYERLASAVTRLHESIARTNDNEYISYVIADVRRRVIAGYGSNILVNTDQSKD